MAPKIRLGVDIGGTFTDVVLEGPFGLRSTKVLTSYSAPEDAIVAGMQIVCAEAHVATSAITQIIHGTTLATNALIERRGARTAFVTTRGFRDVIEMRTESRFEQYDLNLTLPEPLIPRHRRHTLPERMDADGGVLIPLARSEVETLAERLAKGRFEAIAVGFLHAYANDSHEQLVKEVFEERLPGVMISLSSEVSPQMREYERFNTTIANAYIQPLMKSYLLRLEERLAREGTACPIFLMHSGGGIISLASAAQFPVRLVESGPAGGAVFAADIAARHGLDQVLSFDMGGTTAKICLIKNQTPKTARVFEVARSYRFKKGSGMPISIPVIDMVEIGAGGGSLAWRDAMGQIRVGPESAGSEPGPACYGRGGTRPAVTDADLTLGKLDPLNFAGGSIPLSPENSATALTALDDDPVKAAHALAEVVDENMANAARVHAVENGEDLSGYTMIAFGGAAPLHAGRLCEKLGISKCLVPPGAGVGSAIGFLRAPFSFEANRTVFMPLADFDARRVQALFQEMEEEATGFVRSCDADAPITTQHRVYMRYRGQGWEIPVTLSPDQAARPSADVILSHFEAQYEKLFARTVQGMVAEITVWSVSAATNPGAAERLAPHVPGPAAKTTGTRSLFDPASGQTHEASLIDRIAMATGETTNGPALITEAETTIVIPPSRHAHMAQDGTVILSDQGQAPRTSVSDVAYQVMWTRLISVVEEQAQALIRTAFSTSVREAGDLSAGIYNAQGEMLAQAVTGTPGHVNAMADAVKHFIRRIPQMRDGDVYITNDPWEGTGHKHDITIVTPSFHSGRLMGFFACTAHVTDIGGRGFGADANDVHEEGLYIPIMPLMRKGVVDDTLIQIIRGNVREPDQLIGDIYALATCNDIGAARLREMMAEFALSDLTEVSDFILNASREATLKAINALSPGSATGKLRIDGYASEIDLCVTLTIEKDRILSDWTGTSPVDKKGINVPLVYTKAYACYALKCAIAPQIPNNAASLAPFEITAPEGTIVNAVFPAPVALRHVIGHMVPDTVYDALDTLLPGHVPAEGAGCLCNFQLSLRPTSEGGRRAEVLTFNSGGSGARPGHDGMNATAFPSGVMTMPVEATEHVGPVIIWRKELRPDSGGAGTTRGGLGQFMDVGARDGHEFDISAMLDRTSHPARGRRGGKDGGPTRIARSDDAPMTGKGRQFIPEGLQVHMAFPGGAGMGDPHARDRAAVERDVAQGYISEHAARDVYGLSQAKIDAILAALEEGDAP